MDPTPDRIDRRFYIRSIDMWHTITTHETDSLAFWVGTIIPGERDRFGRVMPMKPGPEDEVVEDMVGRDKIYAAVGLIPSDSIRSGFNAVWRGINKALAAIDDSLSLDRIPGRATITRVMCHIDHPNPEKYKNR